MLSRILMCGALLMGLSLPVMAQLDYEETNLHYDTHEQTVVAVWQREQDLGMLELPADYIMLSRSADLGQTWSECVWLSWTDEVGLDMRHFMPCIASDGAGNWGAVWVSAEKSGSWLGTDWDLMISRSTDDGVTWSTPAPLNTDATTDDFGDAYPQLACSGSQWMVTWSRTNSSSYERTFVTRSSNNGASWSAPAQVDTAMAVDREARQVSPYLAANGQGAWVAAWTYHENLPPSRTQYAASYDNGQTWSEVKFFNEDWGDIGDESVQTVHYSGGTWMIAWSYDGDEELLRIGRNIFYAYSSDGLNWSMPKRLNLNATYKTRDDDFCQLTVDANGALICTWTSGSTWLGDLGQTWDFLGACSFDNGRTWSWPTKLNGILEANGLNDSCLLCPRGSLGWLVLWAGSYSDQGSLGQGSGIYCSMAASLPSFNTEARPACFLYE